MIRVVIERGGRLDFSTLNTVNVFRGCIKEFVLGEGAWVFLSRGGLSCSTMGPENPSGNLRFHLPRGVGGGVTPYSPSPIETPLNVFFYDIFFANSFTTTYPPLFKLLFIILVSLTNCYNVQIFLHLTGPFETGAIEISLRRTLVNLQTGAQVNITIYYSRLRYYNISILY